jgi:NitT/TauT family transport system substrate-binding protein
MNAWKIRVPSFISARTAQPATKTATLAVAATTAMILLVGGCTSSAGSAALSVTKHKLEEKTVTVAALPSADLAGLYIAEDEGFFAAEGLTVKISKIASSTDVINDQLKGQIDIGGGSYVPYLAAQASGASFRILAEGSSLGPDTHALVVPAKSDITTLAELAGKKIAVDGTNSIGTLLISELLTEYGVSPSTVHFVTDPAGFPKMPEQLQQGEWSAAFLAEPYVSVAEETYGARILDDLDQGATRNFPIDGYVATQAWVTKNPQTAAAFVQALEEGQEVAASNAIAVQQAMARWASLSSKVTAVMALPDFPTDPVVEATPILRLTAVMLNLDMFTQDFGATVDPQTLVKSMIGP